MQFFVILVGIPLCMAIVFFPSLFRSDLFKFALLLCVPLGLLTFSYVNSSLLALGIGLVLLGGQLYLSYEDLQNLYREYTKKDEDHEER